MSALASIVAGLGTSMAPLRLALRDPAYARSLMEQVGWDVFLEDTDLGALETVLPVLDSLDELEGLVAALEGGGEDLGGAIESTVRIVQSILDTLEALDQLDEGDLTALPVPLNAPSTWAQLAVDLPEFLLVHYLRRHQPLTHALLYLFGVVDDSGEPLSASADDLPPVGWIENNERQVIAWSSLTGLVSDPAGALGATYGWGSEFRHERLMRALGGLARVAGVPLRRGLPREHLAEFFYGPDDPPGPTVRELALPLFRGETENAFAEVGVLFLPIPETTGDGSTDVAGLFVGNLLLGSASGELRLDDDWTLGLAGEADSSGALGVSFRPRGVAVESAGAGVDATIAGEGRPAAPWLLIGGSSGPRLELDGARFEVGVEGTVGTPELVFAGRLGTNSGGGLNIVIEPGEGDSFLSDVLGSADLSTQVALGFRWSSASGFRFEGGASIEAVIPLDLVVGPLDIVSARVKVGVNGDSLAIEAAVTGSLEIGPFAASVDDIGLVLDVVPVDDHSGTFGDVDLQLAFKPPLGLGLALSIEGIASGGGYLYIDHEAGEYAGVVDVDVLGVGITAIGLIATRLPDGSDGWSMFLSLSASFTGLQLGFGFTLNAVGGLVGVNRGLDVEALGEGIRTGAMDSILFPDDPVADAPRILSDLDAIFPSQAGQSVFGPIVKLGWGTPTIVEADLGVVVQLPNPLTFTLLGSLSAVLPDEQVALLALNIDVAGTFDATNGTLSVDASLRDSQVVGLSLTGDMALRATFLDSPSFLMSFGGFNPHFTPPSSFPELNRLSVSLDTGDTLRIGLWGYFGVTSNTIQFGAGADLWAQAVGLTVEGYFSFDALIQFSPFYFVLDLGFAVDVRAGSVNLFGVHLALMFEGPNPFHVLGTAEMKILGISTSFKVDETIGKKEIEAPTETVYAQALLVKALEDAASWAEAPPEADALAVTLADDSEAAAGDVRVHPAGSLEVVQRVVPLKRTLDKYGAAKLGDLSEFRLLEPQIDGEEASSTSELTEWFAPAQYFDMADEERLSSPSFEEMPGGLCFGDDGVDVGVARSFELDYEQVIKDPDIDLIEQPSSFHPLSARSLALSVKRSTVAGARKSAGLPTSTTVVSPYALDAATWVVVEDATGDVATELTSVAENGKGVSWSEARQALVTRSGASAVSLAPAHEVEAA